MVNNFRRAIVSFIGVSLAFGAYSLAVVPFVERVPDDAERRPSAISQTVAAIASTSTDRFVRELTDLGFPQNSWELQRPSVLRTPQATILLKEFKQLEDGSLQIYPCTLIYYGSGRDAKDTERGPTIMQAPEGAILAFDQPINLQKLELDGKITGGRLVGDIRIFSAGGPDSDDLELVTSNVQISDKRIYTRDRVAFRLGNNYGTGRELTLTRGESKDDRGTQDASKGKEPRKETELVDQLALVELHHLEKLTLQLKDDSLFRSFTTNETSKSDPRAAAKVPVNVELRCAGPLRFDLKQQIATVEKNVVLTHQVPQKPANTLQAEQLSLHFAERAEDRRIDGKGDSTSKMSLSRIVAFGPPMVINAASENAYVETKHFEYNFDSKRIKLRAFNPYDPNPQPTASDRVIIRNADHQISAPAIDCITSKDKSKTQIIAQGAGEYVGRVEASQVSRHSVAYSGAAERRASASEATNILATWTHRLSLQPFEGQQVLKVEGNATVRAGEFGQIRTDAVDLWLKQKQIATRIDGTPVFETTPTRLTTYSPSGRPTEIASPQLSGNLKSMTVHFVESEKRPGAALDQTFGRANAEQGKSGVGSQLTNQPKNAYQVEGGEVTAWVDLETQQVHQLVVQGQTRLLESTDGNAKPTEIQGTSIDVRVDPQGRPLVKIAGSPAQLKSPQMELSGENIELRGDENRLFVPGGGKLRVAFDPAAMSGSMAGMFGDRVKTVAPNQPLAETEIEIQWTDELRFDGQTALLLGEVTALGDDLAIRTNDLDIVFQDRIDFSKLDRKMTPKIATITAKKAVMVGTRQRNEAGNVESYQQLVTQDLSANLQSGELLANGPGWIAMTMTADKLPSALGGSAGNVAATGNSSSNELRQLSLTFAKQLRGNLINRNLGMFDNIQGWMGPVARWEERVDPTQVTNLGEEQYRLSCNQLSVFESPTAPPLNPRDPKSRKPFEMIADQGAHVEGQLFFARGERITFVEEKGVLAMRGSNERMAEFWQRNSPTDPGALSGKARLIQYNVNTKKMDARVSDLEIDLSQSQFGDRKSVSIASHQSGRLKIPTRRNP